MVKSFFIGNRQVGPGQPCFIIAEAGVNHNGDVELARKLVDAATASGADAVKFQTFKAEKLVTATARKADYQVRNTGSDESLFDMLKKLELSESDHEKLLSHCRDRGILFLSTPFDEDSADFLLRLGVAAFKVSSGDLTNTPFLKRLASMKLPIILSTGMATMDEVREAVKAVRAGGEPPLLLLQCVSNYPAEAVNTNLRAMMAMAAETGYATGYSDHTLGDEVAIASVALGACVLEKHMTLDTRLPGPDHSASMMPNDFSRMVERIRRVESALGSGIKVPSEVEKQTRAAARKSVTMAVDCRKGDPVVESVVCFKRPGIGIPPSRLESIIGRRFARDMKAGETVTTDCLE